VSVKPQDLDRYEHPLSTARSLHSVSFRSWYGRDLISQPLSPFELPEWLFEKRQRRAFDDHFVVFAPGHQDATFRKSICLAL